MTGFPPRRLVDDVRRLGVEAAAGVAQRFSRLAAPLGSGTAGHGTDPRARLVDDVLDAFSAMARVCVDLAGIAGPTTAGDGDALVAAARPGGSGSVTMWLHNTSSADAGPVRFAATDLIGPAGRVAAGAVTFSPESVERLGAGTSAAVAIDVALPGATAPGSYHGVIAALGLPGAVLPLRLEVGA